MKVPPREIPTRDTRLRDVVQKLFTELQLPEQYTPDKSFAYLLSPRVDSFHYEIRGNMIARAIAVCSTSVALVHLEVNDLRVTHHPFHQIKSIDIKSRSTFITDVVILFNDGTIENFAAFEPTPRMSLLRTINFLLGRLAR